MENIYEPCEKESQKSKTILMKDLPSNPPIESYGDVFYSRKSDCLKMKEEVDSMLQKIRESINFINETGGKTKIYKTNSDDGVKITVKYLYDGCVHEKLLLIENVKKIKIKRETDETITIMCKKFKCKKVFMIVNKASEEISDIVSKI